MKREVEAPHIVVWADWGDDQINKGEHTMVTPVTQEEVDANSAHEATRFGATDYEVTVLAKFWARDELSMLWDYFVTIGGSCDAKDLNATQYRLGEIGDCLGKDELERLVEEATEEFSRDLDPDAWEVFCNGSEEDRLRFQVHLLTQVDGKAGSVEWHKSIVDRVHRCSCEREKRDRESESTVGKVPAETASDESVLEF
jgi:hypothetical protein